MLEKGTVTEINGEKALVLFKRRSSCKNCKACGILADQNHIIVEASNKAGAGVGDSVIVQFTAKNALQTSAWAYVFPLAMLIVGLVLGYNIPVSFMEKEPFAAIFGLIFTAAAFIILKILNPVFKKKYSNVYTITQIANESEQE